MAIGFSTQFTNPAKVISPFFKACIDDLVLLVNDMHQRSKWWQGKIAGIFPGTKVGLQCHNEN